MYTRAALEAKIWRSRVSIVKIHRIVESLCFDDSSVDFSRIAEVNIHVHKPSWNLLLREDYSALHPLNARKLWILICKKQSKPCLCATRHCARRQNWSTHLAQCWKGGRLVVRVNLRLRAFVLQHRGVFTHDGEAFRGITKDISKGRVRSQLTWPACARRWAPKGSHHKIVLGIAYPWRIHLTFLVRQTLNNRSRHLLTSIYCNIFLSRSCLALVLVHGTF